MYYLAMSHSSSSSNYYKYHRPTRFLYLVQTESCLPDNLLTSIGNASNGQCDILVLSYKQECPKILTASHNIEYILNSSTTWTTGRNLLYDVAMRRSERYLYYIFMDDDIELQYHDEHAKQSTGNPWREFEQFLKRLEPAVAALNIKGDSFVKGLARKCSIQYKTEYLHTVWFDAIFNAFHYQAVEYILPYNSKFENESWCYSQIYAIIWSELLFRGQVLMYTDVAILNQLHRRSHPRPQRQDTHGYSDGTITPIIVKDIGKKLPQNYRKMSLFLEWEKDGWRHRETSSTCCLPPLEPHQPIQPYAHINRFNYTFSG